MVMCNFVGMNMDILSGSQRVCVAIIMDMARGALLQLLWTPT
jgi:ABC-type uncharacterized transport system ATPase component